MKLLLVEGEKNTGPSDCFMVCGQFYGLWFHVYEVKLKYTLSQFG